MNFKYKAELGLANAAVSQACQGVLQLQAWVSVNGVLKDCMIKLYLGYRILIKY